MYHALGSGRPERGKPIRGATAGKSGDAYNEVSLVYPRSLSNGAFAIMRALPVGMAGALLLGRLVAFGLLSFANLMRSALVNRDESLKSDRRRAAAIVRRIVEGQRGTGGTGSGRNRNREE